MQKIQSWFNRIREDFYALLIIEYLKVLRHLLLVCIKSKLRRQDFFLIECRDNHKWKNSAHHKDDRGWDMQTISRYVYHDTISPFPLYVDIFITAILIYDITDFIFIFTVQLQVFICMFYVLSCTGILMNIFIPLNNEITFFFSEVKSTT